jgi:hypothetical protein
MSSKEGLLGGAELQTRTNGKMILLRGLEMNIDHPRIGSTTQIGLGHLPFNLSFSYIVLLTLLMLVDLIQKKTLGLNKRKMVSSSALSK